jgi:predicted lipoprotein with Yx(FWY)xxD motif
MKSSTIASIAVILIIIAAGWYWYSQSQTIAPAGTAGINGSQDQGNLGGTVIDPATGAPQQPGADGMIIGANLALGTDATSSLGTYLIAYNGMTVYTFDKDQVGTTTCYGACEQKWPPYIVGAEDNVQQLQAGVNGTAGTIVRADGTIQMTYKGLPLYFYEDDADSGDVNGDNVGGVWHVVKP